MESTVGVRTSTYEGFEITVAAMLRDGLWYPEYQVKKEQEVISHWCVPETEGRDTEDAACSRGIDLARADIKSGLKLIFS